MNEFELPRQNIEPKETSEIQRLIERDPNANERKIIELLKRKYQTQETDSKKMTLIDTWGKYQSIRSRWSRILEEPLRNFYDPREESMGGRVMVYCFVPKENLSRILKDGLLPEGDMVRNGMPFITVEPDLNVQEPLTTESYSLLQIDVSNLEILTGAFYQNAGGGIFGGFKGAMFSSSVYGEKGAGNVFHRIVRHDREVIRSRPMPEVLHPDNSNHYRYSYMFGTYIPHGTFFYPHDDRKLGIWYAAPDRIKEVVRPSDLVNEGPIRRALAKGRLLRESNRQEIVSDMTEDDVRLERFIADKKIELPSAESDPLTRLIELNKLKSDSSIPYNLRSEVSEELVNLFNRCVQELVQATPEYAMLQTLILEPNKNWRQITELIEEIKRICEGTDWINKINTVLVTQSLVSKKLISARTDLEAIMRQERKKKKKDELEFSIKEDSSPLDNYFDQEETPYEGSIYMYTWVDRTQVERILNEGLLPGLVSGFEDSVAPYIYATLDPNNSWASEESGVSNRQGGCVLLKINAAQLDFNIWYPYWNCNLVSSKVCGENGGKKLYNSIIKNSLIDAINNPPTSEMTETTRDRWTYSFVLGKWVQYGFFDSANESKEITLSYVPPEFIEVVASPTQPEMESVSIVRRY